MNRIIHVWQHGGKLSPDTARRNSIARQTWEQVYAKGGWEERGLSDNVLTRTADKVVPRETRDFPFIKDILRYACFGCPDEQVICFTNADTCLAESLGDRIREAISRGVQALHGHRVDFPRIDSPIHESEYSKGTPYPGTDLVIFTAGWWRRNVHDYPDLIMGCEIWDRVMRELIKKTKGEEIKLACAHEKHASLWEAQRMTLPSNIYCRNLARTWLKKNNLPLEEIDFFERPLEAK